ncbi:MAG TPA: hemolysin III family protein [Solirubrobacteraceae bacterium]|nr:hemolysin III family protein [Solirubrobacteraceae bacterium]
MQEVQPTRPRLRGVSHQWAFFAALAAGAALVATAPSGRARAAVAVYAVSLAGLFGTSAIYHRATWRTARTRLRMRRVDHSMIFVLIAGTYTPIAVLALRGALGTAILVVAWAGAAGGVGLQFVPGQRQKWAIAVPYVALGWVAVAGLPRLVDAIGLGPTLAIVGGGLLYSAGAVVYARRRPDPVPAVFGYHEVFHALVIAAAAVHFCVVAFAVV